MGSAILITRLDRGSQDLHRQAAKVRNGRVSRRLLALAMVMEGVPRKAAAEACGMDRQTLCDGVHRYNADGIAGLSDRRGGVSRSLLDEGQMAQLAAWVETGPDPDSMVLCGGDAKIWQRRSAQSLALRFVSAR